MVAKQGVRLSVRLATAVGTDYYAGIVLSLFASRINKNTLPAGSGDKYYSRNAGRLFSRDSVPAYSARLPDLAGVNCTG